MTNKEAKEKLYMEWQKFLEENIDYAGISDAYKTAFKALEQEPCDDAVSREAVIERLKKEDKILYTTTGLNYLIRVIEELPSVTYKSETITEFADRCRECGKMRKGHWIYDKTIEYWRCSKCNETPKTMGYVGTADFMAEHFKFCNHCGAKMESEVEE